MAEGDETTEKSARDLRAELEVRKHEAMISFLNHTEAFLVHDAKSNALLLKLMDVLVEAFQNNPDGVFAGGRGLEEMMAAIQEHSPKESPGAAGDVTGGAPEWVDIMRDIVDIFTSVVKDEKAFFMQIIRLIFCGC
jgi:hypothetical protein